VAKSAQGAAIARVRPAAAQGVVVDSKPIRILIADDHPVVRHGLGVLLGTDPGLEVVGEAASGEEAVEKVPDLKPDVVLMDLVMPGIGGAEATRRIVAENPGVGILVLTSYGSDRKLFPALDAGALGFLLKDSSAEQLVRAIGQVARGQSSLSPAIARRLVREVGGEPPREPLTQREIEVLRAMAKGFSNDGIARELCISPATVRTHVSNILAKLNVSRRTQAVLYALKHGIADLDDDEEPE
jgi:NarL family two-component system response regulator LiaR